MTECRKCGGVMLPGVAMQSILGGIGDFHNGDDVVTLSPTGRGRLVACMKCRDCGRSVTVGACGRCGEPIDPNDDPEYISPEWFHRECAARMVIGGANHLLGRCTCCGGTEPPDDPSLSKREQARVALGIFRAQQAPKGYHDEQ